MIRLSLLVVFAAVCLTLTGCPEAQGPAKSGAHAPNPAVDLPMASPDETPEAAPSGKVENEKKNDLNFAINYNDGFHSHGKGRFGGQIAMLGGHQFHAEFIPNPETGDILAILYDDHFKPFKTELKELTLSLKVDDKPKQYTLLVDFEGSAEKPALYKISDVALAKLLHDGWTGNALVSITVDGKPVEGRLSPLKKSL